MGVFPVCNVRSLTSSVSVKLGSSFASQKLISLYKFVNLCHEIRENAEPDLSETELGVGRVFKSRLQGFSSRLRAYRGSSLPPL